MFGSHSPAKILFRQWKIIVFIGILFAALAVVATLFFPLEYRADAQVLIISRSSYGVDPYTVSKSAERIGENIAQIIRTNDFYSKVISQPQYSLDISNFQGVSERIKRKRWEKTVNASVVFGTGVLGISTYHTDYDQARQFAGAVIDTIVAYGADYVGSDVTIKIVNQPVVTPYPVRPNLFINGLVGGLFGIMLMSFLVLKKRKF